MYPDDNTTDANITVTVDDTSVSTLHFGETFSSEPEVIEYRPKTPQFLSEDHSYWVRNQFSEFQVVAKRAFNTFCIEPTRLDGLQCHYGSAQWYTG